jgi:Zn-dependent protease
MKIDPATGVITYVVFVLSTTAHEAAHAWSAWRLGDETAHRGGLATLDPTPHLRRSPFGMIIIPILSFWLNGWMIGWASTPLDRQWLLEHPRRAGIMALAGPAANLLFVLLAAAGILLGVFLHAFEILPNPSWGEVVGSLRGGIWPFLGAVLGITFSLNLLLFLFNLMPLPPLDGARIPLLALSREWAARYSVWMFRSELVYLGLLLAWKGFNYVYWPVWEFCIRLLRM